MPHGTTPPPRAMLRRLLLVLCQVATCVFLCDAPRTPAQEYVFRAYRQSQGLENLAVNSIATDHQGFLWVGTENGVYRFLGSGFQRFGTAQGLPEPYIVQVFTATDGTVWVATVEDLYQLRGQTFQPALRQPIKTIHASSLASEGAGSLLVIKNGELYRLRYTPSGSSPGSEPLEPVFSPDQLAAHPSLAHLGAIAALPDGTLWMACAKMLCSWEPNKEPNKKPNTNPNAKPAVQLSVDSAVKDGALTEWAEPQGVAPGLYRSIFYDSKGELWAMSSTNIVALPTASDRSRLAFVDRSLPKAKGNGSYSRLPIVSDPSGRILVSMSDGIARWDGSSWQTIGKPNGLISTHPTSLLFDERGNLWMGSNGHGLYHWIGYSQWQGWVENQGLPSSNIWQIGPLQADRLWIGTDKGPVIVDSRTGLASQPPFGKNWTYGHIIGIAAAPGDPATTGDPDESTLLIATVSGKVLKVEGHPSRMTLVADLQGFTYRFLRDSSGRTLLLSNSGVFDLSYLLDKTSHAGSQVPSSKPQILTRSSFPQIDALLGPEGDVTRGCVSPDGALWLVSENGLLRMAREGDRDLWSRPVLQGFPSPLPKLGDVECAKDGSLWVDDAPKADIWRLVYDPDPKIATGPDAGHLRATPLPTPKALPSISIVNLLVDSSGLLWVGTDDGVLVWNGAVWHHLTQEDGLIWNDVNAAKMANGPDGSVWIGTSDGLARALHPERLFAIPSPRIALIEARIGDRLLPLGGAIDFPWSRQDMSLQFAAPDTINRADLRFHYRLAGLQPDFIESSDNTAHFQTLPPGNYSFEVFAQDSVSGTRSGTVAYRFRVLPPWWRTWWFYALCAAAGALGIFSVLRLRTSSLVAQQRRLEAMVRKRTS